MVQAALDGLGRTPVHVDQRTVQKTPLRTDDKRRQRRDIGRFADARDAFLFDVALLRLGYIDFAFVRQMLPGAFENAPVRMVPGLMAFTCTPSRRPASAMALVNDNRAALTDPPMVNCAPRRPPADAGDEQQRPAGALEMRPRRAREPDRTEKLKRESVGPVLLGERFKIAALGGARRC